jgi:hypothetical protein
MVPAQGFEPWTIGLKDRCSNQAELRRLNTNCGRLALRNVRSIANVLPMAFSTDPDVRKFIDELLAGKGALYFTLRAIDQWVEVEGQVPHDQFAVLRANATDAAAEFYKLVSNRHAASGCKTPDEFVVGYVPVHTAVMAAEDAKALGAWYECLGEAFRLVSVKSDTDLKANEASIFQQQFGYLVDRVARILGPLEAKWRRIRAIKR